MVRMDFISYQSSDIFIQILLSSIILIKYFSGCTNLLV